MKVSKQQSSDSSISAGDQLLASVVIEQQEKDLSTIVNNPSTLRISRKNTEVRGFRLLFKDHHLEYTDEQKYASAFITMLEIAGFIEKADHKINFQIALILFSGETPLDEKIKWNHQHTKSSKYNNLTWLQLFYFFDTMVFEDMIEVNQDQFLKRIEVIDVILAFFECSSKREFKPKDIQNAIHTYAGSDETKLLSPPVGKNTIVQKLIQSTAILTQLDHAIFKNGIAR